ncbi:MAG: RNA 3'-terminal phosphate cyclase [Alphaproteobacteria bacterium]
MTPRRQALSRDPPLLIDGAAGEGGGQIIRTALSLAAIKGRAVRIVNIRKGRPRPGLAAQHLTAVRAVGNLCDATVIGDTLGSDEILFAPRRRPRAGDYAFDVGAARAGGSAGASTLVIHAVLLPLVFAEGSSTVVVDGGTYMAWSPPIDHVVDVWAPTLARMGARAEVVQLRAGWYPIGQGRIRATIDGLGPDAASCLRAIDLRDRGRLIGIDGHSVVSRLPDRIAERMSKHASALLAHLDVPIRIEPTVLDAACPGAGVVLVARYQNAAGGFSALGARGKPAEAVAEEAAARLLDHHASGAGVDVHLSDQLLLPMAVAKGVSRFSTATVSSHLATNRAVIEHFGIADIGLERRSSDHYEVEVVPQEASRKGT